MRIETDRLIIGDLEQSRVTLSMNLWGFNHHLILLCRIFEISVVLRKNLIGILIGMIVRSFPWQIMPEKII